MDTKSTNSSKSKTAKYDKDFPDIKTRYSPNLSVKGNYVEVAADLKKNGDAYFPKRFQKITGNRILTSFRIVSLQNGCFIYLNAVNVDG